MIICHESPFQGIPNLGNLKRLDSVQTEKVLLFCEERNSKSRTYSCLGKCSKVKRDWFISTINDDDARQKKREKKSFNPSFRAHRHQNARNFFSLLAWRSRRILFLWNESFLDASFRVAYVFLSFSPTLTPTQSVFHIFFFFYEFAHRGQFSFDKSELSYFVFLSSFFFSLVFYLLGFVKSLVWDKEKCKHVYFFSAAP